MTDQRSAPVPGTPSTVQNRNTNTQSRTHLPGDGHMWLMVLGDLIIFGLYFVIYMVFRSMAVEEFRAAQQHLNLTIGAINTIVLVTSSWFIAQSVLAVRADDRQRAIRLTYAGGVCGLAFIAVKAYEWTNEITEGHTNSNEFFSFYYVLTGVHLIHVILGLVILGVMVRELRNPRRARATMVEQGATYWHMVDLLWIVIFVLLYVMR